MGSFCLLSKTLFFIVVISLQEGAICEQSAISTNEVGVTNPNVGPVKAKLQQNSFTSPVGGSNAGEHAAGSDEYRATYFYPVPHHHHANWNRDSYADAANEFGYNPPHQQPAATSPGASYAPAYGVADEYEDGLGLGGGALGGLGGLGGLAGILGIKGIKGLGLLGLAKIGLPILGVIVLGLLLLPLLFLFFPVPVITVPATTRAFANGINFGDISGKMSTLARSVLESDKCIERISCEMSRVSRGSFIERTLRRVIPRFESHMPQALKRIARVYMEGQPSCNKKYSCYLMDDSTISKIN